ncbi:TIGR03943 family putative permease subunit [Curtobacterium caseinilyticum]|uniref:TIGR03943 family protein n=1 Tax=Curtobacterium caseinilyticum TaxID=3055137 RepID=A0ABT7TR71_9MICO|nr:TIGR03943 family protein [Curtobacterium caseinilyticum]MDM7892092.1 TIGR03943 family protein [Curtobacterium caseinilyticum]
MSSSEKAPAYLGLGSVLAVALCTLWLALVGHLDLYINPRYDLFTVVLAAIAVPASVAGLVAVARGHGHAHDDDAHPGGGAPEQEHARGHAGPDAGETAHEHAGETGFGHAGETAYEHAGDAARAVRRRAPRAARITRGVLGGIAAAATVGVTVAMLVLPPTTLSARTAQQRSVDTPTLSNATGTQDVALLGSAGVDTSQYGVKDWAALIRQTTDTTALVGKPVELTGFVVPGADGSFTLTRFVISCCAVDAQPVGLGVVTEGASGDATPDADRWVRVTGKLAANPDQSADARIVIRAASVRVVDQPRDPYEY